MQTRNYSQRSIETYVHLLSSLEEYHNTCIDEISIDQVKDFLQYVIKTNKLEIISLHTSGHADIKTIKDFVRDLNPVKIIPVHTETPGKYQEIFGDIVSLVDDKMKILA